MFNQSKPSIFSKVRTPFGRDRVFEDGWCKLGNVWMTSVAHANIVIVQGSARESKSDYVIRL